MEPAVKSFFVIVAEAEDISEIIASLSLDERSSRYNRRDLYS